MGESHASGHCSFAHGAAFGDGVTGPRERSDSGMFDPSAARDFGWDRAHQLTSPMSSRSTFTPVGQAQPDADKTRNFVIRHVRSTSRDLWRARADALTIISPRRLLEFHIRNRVKKSRQVLRPGEIALIPRSTGNEYVFGAMDALTAIVPRRTIAAALEIMGRNHESEIVFRQVNRARDPWVAAMMTELWDEIEHGIPDGAGYVEAIGTSLVIRLVKRYGKAAPEARSWGTSTDDLRIRRTLEYLEHRLTQDVPLAAVARHVGLSGPHLSAVFKEATGESIAAYTRRRRLERARDLLRSAGMSVGEVAEQVGYASVGHFATAFRIAFGVSPGKYRKSARG
jgi:AraC-like DNA-binding protein